MTATSVTDWEAESAARLGRLFDLFQRRLYRLALRMTSDVESARDLVQDAFLRAAARPSSVPGDDAGAEAWLVRVVVNLCRDRYRRQRVRLAKPAVAEPDHIRGHEDEVVASATLWKALRTLPPRRRAVLVMHEIEELDPGTIARLLGISRVTVRWHLSVGRKELAATIEEPRRGGR